MTNKKVLKSSTGIIALAAIFILLASAHSLFLESGPAREIGLGIIFVAALGAFAGMLILPLLTIKFVLKEKLQDFGWQLPREFKKAVWLTILATLFLAPFMLYFANQETFQRFYSLEGFSFWFVLGGAVLSAIYYFAEEFLVRGFLFWGLWRNIRYHSFWVTSVIFAFFHIQKPLPEIIFAFLASLLFCYLSFKTKSFIPAAAAHFGIALLLNILVNFK